MAFRGSHYLLPIRPQDAEFYTELRQQLPHNLSSCAALQGIRLHLQKWREV